MYYIYVCAILSEESSCYLLLTSILWVVKSSGLFSLFSDVEDRSDKEGNDSSVYPSKLSFNVNEDTHSLDKQI